MSVTIRSRFSGRASHQEGAQHAGEAAVHRTGLPASPELKLELCSVTCAAHSSYLELLDILLVNLDGVGRGGRVEFGADGLGGLGKRVYGREVIRK